MGHLLELDEVTTTLSELTGPSPWGSCPTREERALSGRFQQRRAGYTWEGYFACHRYFVSHDSAVPPLHGLTRVCNALDSASGSPRK